jgi:hypothetical protein
MKRLITLAFAGLFSTFIFADMPFDVEPVKKSVCKLVADELESRYEILHPVTLQPLGASFTEKEQNVFYCSATVVGPQTVFTAAHCYQGIIEQHLQKGRAQLPKMQKVTNPNGTVRYEIIPGCDLPGWREKPDCLGAIGPVRLETVMNGDVKVVCPGDETGEEIRTLPLKQGWPNPRFNKKFPRYDITIWKTAEPFTKTPALSFVTNYAEVSSWVQQSFDRCVTFGYGPVPQDAQPKLKSLYTPVDTLSEEFITSLGFDHVVSGDSGGSFVCADFAGKPHLVGITSYTQWLSDPNFGINGEMSGFSSLSFNKPWIDLIAKTNFPHEGREGTNTYHTVALQYENQHIWDYMNQSQNCLNQKRNLIDRDQLKQFQSFLNGLRRDHQTWMNAYRHGEIAGLVRAKLKEVFLKNDALLTECRAIQ